MKNSIFHCIAISLLCWSLTTWAQPVSNPKLNIPVADSPTYGQYFDYRYLTNITGVSKFNVITSIVPDEPVTSLPTGHYLHRQRKEYYDGLGRPLQNVDKRGHADEYDLVQHFVYDSLERVRYQYLPFAVPAPVASIAGNIKLDAKDKFSEFYEHLGPDEEPFSRTDFDIADESKVVKQLPPGRSWVGSERGVATNYMYNLANEVRRWDIDNINSDFPVSSGFYNAGELYVTQTIDEDNNYAKEYTDKDGLLVLKKSVLATGHIPLTAHEGFACTYYVYDDQKQLRFVIPPKAVKLIDGVWNVSTVPELCFSYLYDNKGRLVEKKVPGKQVEEYVYDKRDRLVYSRDGNQKQQGKWAFMLHDALDRPIANGIGNYTSPRNVLQGLVNDVANQYPAPSIWAYINNFSLYHNYPSSVEAGTILAYNFYDNYENFGAYSFEPGFITGYLPTSPHPEVETPVLTQVNRGLLTASKTRVIDPEHPSEEKWLTSVHYYDNKGRKIQTVSENLLGGMDITSTIYYFQGKPWKTITYHKNPGAKKIPNATDGAIDEYTLVKTYTRNVGLGGTDQVWKIDSKISDGPTFNLVNYDYDHLGRVTVKDLRAGLVLQEYNMRGFLSHIAAEDHSVLPHKAIFDERIRYDWGFASKLYSGNIAGIIWSGSESVNNAYGYSYDRMDRLTHAEYRLNTGSTWSNLNKDYSAANITYDLNGNILTMNQRGGDYPNDPPMDMDKLRYEYEQNSNRLQNVEDGGDVVAGLPDFRNGTSNATEYTYDANGNLTHDGNKKIQSITYSYLNKPELITTDSGTIAFTYDASGNLLRKKVNRSTGTTTFEYDGEFVYQDSVLQYILNEEGRARPVADISTNFYTRFVYDYFIKDHLGNVRSTVTANPITADYLARHEISTANVEQLMFDNIPNVRDGKPGSTDPSDGMAAHLDASNPDTRIGTAIMLKVMPGDKFSISANTWYQGEYLGGEETGSNAIVESLASALMNGGTYDGIPVAELPENIRTVQKIFGNPALAEKIANLQTNDITTAPKAHLNYLFFNESMELQSELSGSIQVQPIMNTGWQMIENNGVCNCTTVGPAGPGYILVYVDNQSIGKSVWFDDIRIEHYTSSVLEENHYYPFGLTLMTMNSGSNNKNDIKFQSQRHNTDLGINIYGFKYREQDPTIGRFWQIDPLASDYVHNSPYAFSENKVTSHFELEGLEAITINPPASTPGIGSAGGAYMVFTAWNNKVDAIAANPYAYPETGFGQHFIRKREEAGVSNFINLAVEIAPTVIDGANAITDKVGKALDNIKEKAKEIKSRSSGTFGGKRAGKSMTPSIKRKAWEQNKDEKGGVNECENCGMEVKRAPKSEKGVKTPEDAGQVDHIYPKAKGGDGTLENSQILCPSCNRTKSDNLPIPKTDVK